METVWSLSGTTGMFSVTTTLVTNVPFCLIWVITLGMQYKSTRNSLSLKVANVVLVMGATPSIQNLS